MSKKTNDKLNLIDSLKELIPKKEQRLIHAVISTTSPEQALKNLLGEKDD